jgi:hypothetical protein
VPPTTADIVHHPHRPRASRVRLLNLPDDGNRTRFTAFWLAPSSVSHPPCRPIVPSGDVTSCLAHWLVPRTPDGPPQTSILISSHRSHSIIVPPTAAIYMWIA